MKIKKRYLVALSILLIALIIYSSSPTSIIDNLLKIKPSVILPLIVLVAISILIRTWKWQFLLNETHKIPFFKLIPVNLSGTFLRDTLPAKAGEPLKAVFLKQLFGIPTSKGIVSVIWDRVMDFLALASFGLLFITLNLGNPKDNTYTAGLIGLVIILIVCGLSVLGLTQKKIGLRLGNLFMGMPLIGRLLNHNVIENFYSTRVGSINLIINYFLTILAIVFEGMMFYLIFDSMGVEVEPLFIVVSFSFSVLCGFASFLPAGLGSLEAVMVMSLMSYGLTQGQAAAGVLTTRSFAIIIMYLLGLLSYLVVIKPKKGI